MPNHIYNKLTIKNEKTLEQVLDYMEHNPNYEEVMDFNKIVPMPEYIFKGNLSTKEETLYGSENCWFDWSLNN